MIFSEKNKFSVNILIPIEILVISFIINSFNLPNNLFFGHEQGRDAFAIVKIYKERDIRLIGTKTEIEGVFSPPWYYYLMIGPYAIAGGNPTIASFFLVFLSSTTAPIIYFLTKDLLKSPNWSIISAIIAALSLELITYARWLSNVTLAFPFIALAYFALFKYATLKKQQFFLLFTIFATIASQFQVTLTFQFLFIIIAMIFLKLIKTPTIIISLLSIVFFLLAFSSLIIFDFRNQHLITKSIVSYLTNQADLKLNFDIVELITHYIRQLTTVVTRSILNVKTPIAQIAFSLLILLGLILTYKEKQKRQVLFFTLILCFMSLGIFIFNIGLTQLYQGTAIGFIILVTIALSSLWKLPQTKILTLTLFTLLIVSWVQNFKSLYTNNNFFPAPEQNVLRLEDQRALIDFMHNDSEVKPYRFESFTVPFLHSEGWQYLHQYYYPREESKHSKLIYIAIEKNIPAFWEQKWIGDLGETKLIFEKKFGAIRLQKRQIRS